MMDATATTDTILREIILLAADATEEQVRTISARLREWLEAGEALETIVPLIAELHEMVKGGGDDE